MSGGHKLLEILGGRPVIALSVGAALDAELGPVLVVTGDRSPDVEAALPPGVAVIQNPDWRSGMASSLRLATLDLPETVDAFAVALGDMPLVRATHYRALAGAWTSGSVAVPVHEGRRGHPVIWSREFAAEMGALRGDRGARVLLERHTDRVIEVEMEDRGVLVDVDTREQLDAVRSGLSRGG